jgi:EmrB/QacA subfamily drug resistance transporter
VSPDPHRQHYGLTLGVLALAALAFSLLQTMVFPALPAIQRETGASTESAAWVFTAFLLTASVATPVLGRLGDMFGKERVLLLVLTVFALGCLVAALSHSLEMLIAGRAIQGVAGAIFPLSFGIIRDEFPRERVATGIGLISSTFGIGGGIGLVLAGVLVDSLSYEWIFWFGFAVTLVAMVATHLFVPESPIKSPARIDWAGAALLTGALVALLVAVSRGNHDGWGSSGILALLTSSAVLFVVWWRWEVTVDQPMVDVRLLRERGVWTVNLTAVLMGFGMLGSFVLIPTLVQTPEAAGFGFGEDVTGAGLFMLPSSAMMLFAGPVAGMLGKRFGSKIPMIAGIVLTSAAFGLLAVAHDEAWQILLASAVLGIGIGFGFAAMANLIIQAVPQSRTGEASGMNTIMRTVGGALGAQIAASTIAAHVGVGGFPAESGFTQAFAMGAVAMALAAVVAVLIPRRRAAVPALA